MALFLEIRELKRQDVAEFLRAGCDGVHCLKHWLGEDGRHAAFLVEADDVGSLVARRGSAKEITELFAPADRWASYDSIEVA